MTRDNQVANRPALAALAIVSWAGVLLQLWLSVDMALANGKTAGDGVVAFLGYFTVLSNLFVALSATLPLVVRSSGPGSWFGKPMVLGCATTAILLVGIAYHLLLRDVWAPQGLQLLADSVLHYVVPVSALAYWALYASRNRLGFLAPLVWCLYPAGYLIYALVRGAALGSYPYHFIDVTSLGYRQVLVNGFGLLVAFLVLGAFVVAITLIRNRFPPMP
ncbi:Pr6Pr family membrane protein [Luteimonas suaedae]|uniref:Pr6Pr family membrane protein n=1 Tax=Luteimonas suaedae TaxID=2605430 RepID=UPI0011ECF1E0|nr:Pr6Pr family membrane protein [Luteimonas suaedae]